jgi:hypothetical protein
MPADFPAAHSMDSCWFAVDRDGHIGYFETGESGAMPEVGICGDDAYEVRDRLARMLPAGDVLFDPGGRTLPGESVGPLPDHGFPALVFLSHLAPAQSDVEAGRATVVRATEGYAVAYRQLTAAQARRLRDSGAVTAWAYHYDDPAGPGGLARHGIYEYTHLCENWIAGPYGREQIPARRVHVDQLPPDIRKPLKEARLLDRSFSVTPHIQPMEHWPCQSWEPGWLGTDGVVRPVPGRGDEYAERMEEMQDDTPQYRFEPPPVEED